MTPDHKAISLRRRVADLIEAEGEVAALLETAREVLRGHPDALSAVLQLQPVTEKHRGALGQYLRSRGVPEPWGRIASHRPMSRQSASASDVLQEICLAFHRCALSYAILYEVALRLFDPALRDLAPRHLKASADAAMSMAMLLPGVVAGQLASEGHDHCACTCPMCGLGACGCVALGTQTLQDALRGAVPDDTGPPGLKILPPRPGSALAMAGVQGGDLLLAIEGRQVRSNTEIQAELRKHALGDEIRVRIQHGADHPREITVRHAGDYPGT